MYETIEFEVSAQHAVLELSTEHLELGNKLIFSNSTVEPTDTIYAILPSSANGLLNWYSSTYLKGANAELIILTQKEVAFWNSEFKDFRQLVISDNKFYRDGAQFLVMRDDEHYGCKVTFSGCMINKAYFLCNALKIINGEVSGELKLGLHGSDSSLEIAGTYGKVSRVGSIRTEGGEKIRSIKLENVDIVDNLVCEEVENLSINKVRSGKGNTRLIADNIEKLNEIESFGREVIVRGDKLKINSMLAPIGKVEIDVNSYIEFTRDGRGNFSGIELHMDVSKATGKDVEIPYGVVKFNKIVVNGANKFRIPGSVIANILELTNCNKVMLNEVSVGYLKYEAGSSSGEIEFGGFSRGRAKIDSLCLIGKIKAEFSGPSEIFDLEAEGKSYLYIRDNYKGNIIKLNLNIQPLEVISHEVDGSLGLLISNNYDKVVEIDTIFSKINYFYVNGSVKLGRVICQPVDANYNVIDVAVKNLKDINIKEFFAGFDHNIVIDLTTGKMSLVQSLDRALTGSSIIASVHGSVQNYLNIRAGQGLSFSGNLKVIEGDIDLFCLFGKLSVKGNLTASNEIRLIAVEGSLDLTAMLNARSVVTYAKTDNYLANIELNAKEFLSTVLGKYIVRDSIIKADKTVIISQDSDIMMRASFIKAILMEMKAREEIVIRNSTLMSEQSQGYEAMHIDMRENVVRGNKIGRIATGDISIIDSRETANEILNIAGSDAGLRQFYKHFISEYDLIESSGSDNDNAPTTGSVQGDGISNDSKNTNKVETKANSAEGSIRIKGTEMRANKITNIAGRNITIENSRVGATVMENDVEQGNLHVIASQLAAASMKNITRNTVISNSELMAAHDMYFKALQNFLSIASNIELDQHQVALFTSDTNAKNRFGEHLVKVGFDVKGVEVLGLIDSGNDNKGGKVGEVKYRMVDSSTLGIEPFVILQKEEPGVIMIDAHTGVLIGSKVRASGDKSQVIIRTTSRTELLHILPVEFYNAIMFSGGFNSEGLQNVITKIEAGLIDIDGGNLIKLVGALLKGVTGNLKADYVLTQGAVTRINEIQHVLHELSPWLSHPRLYNMIVNSEYVATKLEFSELTRIDVGRGKVDVYFPYESKEVNLIQRQGDIVIDRNVHFNVPVMAIHADNGKIFIGSPQLKNRVLRFIERFSNRFGEISLDNTPQLYDIGHVGVSGNNILLSGNKGVDIHGVVTASDELGIKSKGNINIVGDKHRIYGDNYTSEIAEPSVIRAGSAFLVGDNISIVGSVVEVKDHLKMVSQRDIKVIPIEIMYHYWQESKKTTIEETRITNVVSSINAGHINIDAGRALEFVGALISAEDLDIHASSLNIRSARDIFESQVDFRGKKKHISGKRNTSSTHDIYETVVPTIIYAGNQRILVDNDASLEAAQIFASNDILLKVGGNLSIKDGYNFHLHDYHQKSYKTFSSKGGKMTLNQSRTVHESYTEHESVPTIICAGGTFYGIVNGTMQMLGSKIIGNDIHIVAPKGFKLEASKYTDYSMIFVHETGLKVGCYGEGRKGRSGGGFKACVYGKEHRESTTEDSINPSSLVASNSLHIVVENGTFEQISSELSAKLIKVEARDWEVKTLDANIINKTIDKSFEAGIRIGVRQHVTETIDKIKQLVHKRGHHAVDQADRLFKAYDAYKSVAMLSTNAVSAGVYAYGEFNYESDVIKKHIAIDNTINGEAIIARIQNDIRFSGVKMTANNVDIEARNFIFETSSDRMERVCKVGNVNIELNLATKNFSAGLQAQEATSSQTIHHENYIRASGNLTIRLSGDGRFKGVSLEGGNVNISANNLLLESVQDKLNERMKGFNLNIGFDDKYGMNGFGVGVKHGDRDAEIVKQAGRIIGSNLVNIAVKDTIELAGGMIANAKVGASGRLEASGNLEVNCGRMILKTLHDYDHGETFGIGISFAVNQVGGEKGKKNEVSFDHATIQWQYHNENGKTHAVIGQGVVTFKELQGELRRDIGAHKEALTGTSFEFNSTVHSDMLAVMTGQQKANPRQTAKQMVREKTEENEGNNNPFRYIGHFFGDLLAQTLEGGKDIGLGLTNLGNILGMGINIQEVDKRINALLGQNGLHLTKHELDRLARSYERLNLANGGTGKDILPQQLAMMYRVIENIAEQSGDDETSILTFKTLVRINYEKAVKEAQQKGTDVSFEQIIGQSLAIAGRDIEYAKIISNHVGEILREFEILRLSEIKLQLELAERAAGAARSTTAGGAPDDDEEISTSFKQSAKATKLHSASALAYTPSYETVAELIKATPATNKSQALVNEILLLATNEEGKIDLSQNFLGKLKYVFSEIAGVNSAEANPLAATVSSSVAGGAVQPPQGAMGGYGPNLSEIMQQAQTLTRDLGLPNLASLIETTGWKVALGFTKIVAEQMVKEHSANNLNASVVNSVGSLYDKLVGRRLTTETIHIPNIADITYERRGDSAEVALRKVEIKDQFKAVAKEKIEQYDTCDALKKLPYDQLALVMNDISTQIIPETIERHLPDPWNNKDNVIGILKHSTLKNINDAHRTRCNDTRLRSEVPFKMERDLTTLRDDEKTPGYLKGSVRPDLITDTTAHPELPKTAYDAKFGAQGMTNSEVKAYVQHLGEDYTIKELRPSDKGGITTKHVGIPKKP